MSRTVIYITRFTNATVVTTTREDWHFRKRDYFLKYQDEDHQINYGDVLVLDGTDDVSVYYTEMVYIKEDDYSLRVEDEDLPETITEDVYEKLSPAFRNKYHRAIYQQENTVNVEFSEKTINREFLNKDDFIEDISAVSDIQEITVDNENSWITRQLSRDVEPKNVLSYFYEKLKNNDDWMSAKFISREIGRSYIHNEGTTILNIRYHSEAWTERTESVPKKTKAGHYYRDGRRENKHVPPKIKDDLTLYSGKKHDSFAHEREAWINIYEFIKDSEKSYSDLREFVDALFDKVTFNRHPQSSGYVEN